MNRIVSFVLLVTVLMTLFSYGEVPHNLSNRVVKKGSVLVEPKTRENSYFLAGRVIIKFKEQLPAVKMAATTGIHRLDKILSKYSITSIEKIFQDKTSPAEDGKIDLSKFYVITYTSPYDPFTVAEELSYQADIEYAEPWFIYPVNACTPNDPSRSLQWHLTKVLADSAWCVQTGDTTIVIGIVDTGIQLDHPDLAANIWHNPGESGDGKETNGIDDDGNGKIDDWRGWDFGGANYSNPIEDNNPVPTASNNAHGTHVAGIASAVTNNGVGVSGIAYNCKLLAVKTTSDDDFRSGGPFVVFGFEGIVYAADMGAKVINCSWGGGGFSQFEQEVITYATQQGSIVVAAAGNAANETPNYPASYEGVYSIAATTTTDTKASYSQYGAYVDMSAPGNSILSTLYPSSYTSTYSGTSMASPLAAGLIALVKSRFPSYTMQQAAEQVRISCDNIDDINTTYRYKLGRGRINAYNALTMSSPSIRFSNLLISDSVGGNNNGIPERAETLAISMSFTNYLLATSSATATLTTTDSYITLLDTSFSIGALATLQSVSNVASPFRVVVKNTMPYNRAVNFTLRIQDGGYTDVFLIPVFMSPTYNNHTANNIKVTLTNRGSIGFNDFPGNQQGIGFVFGGANQLFEGGLLIGYSTTKLVNIVRNASGGQDKDFSSSQPYVIGPGTISDQDGSTSFTDSAAPSTNRVGVRVNMYSYAFINSPDNNYIIVRYDIENISGATITNLYAGLFFDWDIQNFATNKAAYDTIRQLGYAWDAGSTVSVYCGSSVLEGTAGFRALVNNSSIDLSDAAKYGWLSGGIVTNSAVDDIHYTVSSGPYTLAPGATARVAFALIGGNNLAELQSSADAAVAKWNAIKILLDVNEGNRTIPLTYSLEQNYPNPFNPTTEIRYQTKEVGNVLLTIYDVLGREVATLVNERKPAGMYTAHWNAQNLPNGVYFYRVVAGDFVETKKMILMK
jgi:serine protease